MSLDPQALADGWAASFDRTMRRAAGFPDARIHALARRLPFYIAVMDLDGAHPDMRSACRIRAEQIVAEIGWPKDSWLKRRVAHETKRFCKSSADNG